MTQTSYNTGRYEIPAGGSITVHRAADYLSCLDSTAPFRVRFDDGTTSDFEAGLTLKTPSGFNLVEVLNNGSSPLTVRFGFGRGDVRDSRLTFTGSIKTEARSPEEFNGFAQNAVGTTTAKQLIYAHPKRATFGVKNLGTVRVWINDTNALEEAGYPLEPGAEKTFETSAQLFIYNPDASAVVSYVSWETRRYE